jgi:hypothetical protein
VITRWVGEGVGGVHSSRDLTRHPRSTVEHREYNTHSLCTASLTCSSFAKRSTLWGPPSAGVQGVRCSIPGICALAAELTCFVAATNANVFPKNLPGCV